MSPWPPVQTSLKARSQKQENPWHLLWSSQILPSMCAFKTNLTCADNFTDENIIVLESLLPLLSPSRQAYLVPTITYSFIYLSLKGSNTKSLQKDQFRQ